MEFNSRLVSKINYNYIHTHTVKHKFVDELLAPLQVYNVACM